MLESLVAHAEMVDSEGSIGEATSEGKPRHLTFWQLCAVSLGAERPLLVYSIPSVSRQTWHPVITFCPSGNTLQPVMSLVRMEHKFDSLRERWDKGRVLNGYLQILRTTR